MDASNEMMDGERVRARAQACSASAPHLYCASSSEPMRCSQVLYCVVCWSVMFRWACGGAVGSPRESQCEGQRLVRLRSPIR